MASWAADGTLPIAPCSRRWFHTSDGGRAADVPASRRVVAPTEQDEHIEHEQGHDKQ
jgi:hypothetical protein